MCESKVGAIMAKAKNYSNTRIEKIIDDMTLFESIIALV